ncbi:MAG: hypothetical protein HY000_40945 [Planctomycetes bacterium]|nr:hypothetical protein [Planctomycetota bacterium]
MAHLHLNDIALAEDCYQQAIDWMARNKPDDPELLRFRQEAERMLAIALGRDPTATAEKLEASPASAGR